MDGMRKVPDNVPDRGALEPYLHMPLTAVPDPFGGGHESFGHHNNAMLRPSSTRSASSTNSPAPPTITSPAASTRS
jgi:lysyl-tRNA synthetase class I